MTRDQISSRDELEQCLVIAAARVHVIQVERRDLMLERLDLVSSKLASDGALIGGICLKPMRSAGEPALRE